jgi:hypothetical protein
VFLQEYTFAMSGSDFRLTESVRAVFTCERGTVQFYFVDALIARIIESCCKTFMQHRSQDQFPLFVGNPLPRSSTAGRAANSKNLFWGEWCFHGEIMPPSTREEWSIQNSSAARTIARITRIAPTS